MTCRAENLCHQAVFVDDATRTVKPLDPEVVQVGDAIWQGPQWCGLAQRTVRTHGRARPMRAHRPS
jgi:hypothetical protein